MKFLVGLKDLKIEDLKTLITKGYFMIFANLSTPNQY